MDYKDYMDYNQRDYFFQMQQMRQMPFSPMHPWPDLYMSEIETERDLQYLQQMYPADAKRMQRKVEEECDKLEYEGSMMYDEYPDRVTMLLMCDRIADALAREDAEKQAAEEAGQMDEGINTGMDTGTDADNNAGGNDEMNAMQMRRPDYGPGPELLPFGPDRRPGRPPFEPDRRPERPPHHGPKPGPGRPPMDPGRRNLLEVLLYNEMYKRRCKRRRTRRFW